MVIHKNAGIALPPSQPTHVAYACMLMLRQVMREQYRLAKEAKAMRDAEAAATPTKPAKARQARSRTTPGAKARPAAREGAG